MVVLLQEEQKDDEAQKKWCETEFDTSEDKEGELKRKIAGLEAAIAEMKEGIATLKDDIKALSDGIVALDKSRKRAEARDRGEFKFRSTYNASMTYIDVYVLFVFVQ